MINAIILFLTIFFLGFNAQASVNDVSVPADLEAWKTWVLHGKEKDTCPAPYNDASLSLCLWHLRLELNLDNSGGSFSQSWLAIADNWTAIPGGTGVWPKNVTVDGKAVQVIEKNGSPAVFLLAGERKVAGIFKWDQMPEMLKVPPSSGLISLSVNGKSVDFPQWDKDSNLWLQKRESTHVSEDSLYLTIYRLIRDTIPMQVVNHLKINISGKVREERLFRVFLENTEPLRIDSPLPLQIDPKGDLLIQARPGEWNIEILSRVKSPLDRLSPITITGDHEIWSFEAQPNLRIVNIEGLSPTDPNKSDMPAQWKSFPAFVMKSGEQMIFKEKQRGNPDPSPDQLNLQRTWWLDFDGQGFTIQDNISGSINRTWRLSMNAPTVLGRVSVDGADQLITTYGTENKPGVELRRGTLNLEADSRIETDERILSAVGWNHDFVNVSARLNLPPGWRLFSASGPDTVSGTWFQRWTLLDLFLVLLISLSVWKLKSLRPRGTKQSKSDIQKRKITSSAWGILTLATMLLIFHETNAPHIVWIHLIAATALLPLLPDGKFKKLVSLWRIGAIVFLVIIALPFMLNQIRSGIYPQLEKHYGYQSQSSYPVSDSDSYSGRVEREISRAVTKESVLKDEAENRDYYPQQSLLSAAPDALIQTGPGLPAWQWRSVSMKWNAPVDKMQEIKFWLISPALNLMLAFLRVIFLGLLIAGLSVKGDIPK